MMTGRYARVEEIAACRYLAYLSVYERQQLSQVENKTATLPTELVIPDTSTQYMYSFQVPRNTKSLQIHAKKPAPALSALSPQPDPSLDVSKNVSAPTTNASVPVLSVGCTTGAKNGLWFVGMSSSLPSRFSLSQSSGSCPPKNQ